MSISFHFPGIGAKGCNGCSVRQLNEVQLLFCVATEFLIFFFLMLLNLFQSLLKTGFNIVTTKRTHTHEDKAVRCLIL